MHTTQIVSVLSCILAVASAKLYPTGTGCVDPVGVVQCVADIDAQFTERAQTCSKTSSATGGTVGEGDCLNALNNWQNAAYIGCFIQSCWDKVYGCDYQSLVVQYFDSAGLMGPFSGPFFPAPAGAPGACSCDLVEAYSNMTYVYLDQSAAICTNVAGNGDREALSYCQCCDQTRKLSAAINTCPGSDLSILGMPSYIENMASLQPYSSGFDCSPILNSDQCTSEFGFVLEAGTEFYNPVALPSGVPGTEPLSDIGSLTTFPAAQTFSVTIAEAGYTSTITMVPADTTRATSTATASGSSRASGSSQASVGSQTSSGSQATGSSGASNSAIRGGASLLQMSGLLIGLVAFAML